MWEQTDQIIGFAYISIGIITACYYIIEKSFTKEKIGMFWLLVGFLLPPVLWFLRVIVEGNKE
ncbi:hypothetical protein [Bacillus sp. XF8]|uniref:hypothetical protein n=1 Tax=Bacillus sp. XF8 TaxID=2819289 RepID=UPI001AA03614|nr:hypothetical protein [Bacillus sp. XF8]MBO1578589.1 hypothetical protein [Bacillus sp. XF8]